MYSTHGDWYGFHGDCHALYSAKANVSCRRMACWMVLISRHITEFIWQCRISCHRENKDGAQQWRQQQQRQGLQFLTIRRMNFSHHRFIHFFSPFAPLPCQIWILDIFLEYSLLSCIGEIWQEIFSVAKNSKEQKSQNEFLAFLYTSHDLNSTLKIQWKM